MGFLNLKNKNMENSLKQEWFCIEYSPVQKCMHIEVGLKRQPSNGEWELVEKFYGTMIDANTKANKILEQIEKKRKFK